MKAMNDLDPIRAQPEDLHRMEEANSCDLSASNYAEDS